MPIFLEIPLSQKIKKKSRQNNCNRQRSSCTTSRNAACLTDTISFDETNLPNALHTHHCQSLFSSSCCEYCKAYRWPGELESLCCCKGKVVLPPLPCPPNELIQLFDINRSGKSFVEHITEGESGLKRWSGHMMRIFGSIARRYVYSLKIYKQKSQWNLKLVKIRIKSENITIVKYCNSKQ